MANITISIPDEVLGRVLDGLSTYHSYKSTIFVDGEYIANPETRAEFCKRKIIEHIKKCVRQVEYNSSVDLVQTNLDNDINANLNLS
jgi:hypothetical protein